MFVIFFLLSTLTDQIAAYVGEEVILESEVQQHIDFYSKDPAAQEMFADVSELRDYILNELISQRLVVAEAESESISVAGEEIEPRVELYINAVKEQYPSEADFFKDLQEQGITLEDLKRNYEKNVKTELIRQKLMAKKFPSITVSPIAVKEFYEDNKDSIAQRPGRVKLSHILMYVRPSEAQLKKGFEKALDVYKLLFAGGDFGVIAQEFSDDENTKHKGGMLGKIKRGETIEEFEAAIFDLKPGVISQPIPTRLGYHIVEVLNKGPDWVLARQILIEVTVTRSDTLRYEELANRIRKLVNNGADFDSLAQRYSDASDIDIGEYYVNQLSPPVDSIVSNLEESELSEPMLTPVGYHLIYLREKIPGETLIFEELRDYIYKYLHDQKSQKKYAQLIDELKTKIYVKTFEKK